MTAVAKAKEEDEAGGNCDSGDASTWTAVGVNNDHYSERAGSALQKGR
jgi:hypothetical protein